MQVIVICLAVEQNVGLYLKSPPVKSSSCSTLSDNPGSLTSAPQNPVSNDMSGMYENV